MAYLVWFVVGALVEGATASSIAPSTLGTPLATTGAADAMPVQSAGGPAPPRA